MLTFFLGFLLGVIITVTVVIMYVIYVRKQAEKQLEEVKIELPEEEVVLEEEVNINPQDYIKPDAIWIDKNWEDTIIKIIRVSPEKSRVRFVYLTLNGKNITSQSIQEHGIQTLLFAYKPKLNSNE